MAYVAGPSARYVGIIENCGELISAEYGDPGKHFPASVQEQVGSRRRDVPETG